MEERTSEYLALFEAYKEQLESLDKQAVYIQALIEDCTKAKVTVEKLGKDKEELLIPIGGGVFLHADYKGDSKVLLSEGAGVVIERDSKYAVDALDKRIEELSQGLLKLNDMAVRIQQKMQEISSVLQKVLEKEK
jgi:prefoldin alpha subunit